MVIYIYIYNYYSNYPACLDPLLFCLPSVFFGLLTISGVYLSHGPCQRLHPTAAGKTRKGKMGLSIQASTSLGYVGRKLNDFWFLL